MFTLMFTLMSVTFVMGFFGSFLRHFGVMVIHYTSVSIMTSIRVLPGTFRFFGGLIGVLLKYGTLLNNFLLSFGTIFVHSHGGRGVSTLRSSMSYGKVTNGHYMTITSVQVSKKVMCEYNSVGFLFFDRFIPLLGFVCVFGLGISSG